jgi:hypothetical protein
MIRLEAFQVKREDFERAREDYENLLYKLNSKAVEIVRILFEEEKEEKLYIKWEYGTLFIHSSNVAVLLRKDGSPIYLERNEVMGIVSIIDRLYEETAAKEH